MFLNPLHRVVLSTYDNGAHAALAEQDSIDPEQIPDPLLGYLLTTFSDDASADRGIASANPADHVCFMLREMMGILDAMTQVKQALIHHGA